MTAPSSVMNIPGASAPIPVPNAPGAQGADPAPIIPPVQSTAVNNDGFTVTRTNQITINDQTTTTSTEIVYSNGSAPIDPWSLEPGYAPSTPSTPITNGKAQTPLENPLHSLNNYTYNLSLHMIGIDQFNRLLESSNPAKDYVPQNVLIASAGKYNQQFVRNINFREDFYFDDFKMKTYISTTQRNRNSNLIEMTFTIIEPNGFTLIDRCIQTFIQVENNNPGNFLSVPYMLQIDFYGYDDEGNLQSTPLEDFRKFIPVRLVKMDTKITTKGTEYQVQCTPFNHEAYRQIYATLPITTTATGVTVSDIFGKLTIEQARQSTALQTTVNKQRELERDKGQLAEYLNNESAAESARLGLRTQRENIIQQIENINKQLSGPLSKADITGFCDAMNEWYKYQQKSGIAETVSSVSVVFDPEIKNAKLLDGPQPSGVASAANSTDAARAAAGLPVSLNFNGGSVNIPAGTDITKLIDWAVRNSEYISSQLESHQDRLKQIQNGANPNISDTWLNWFKIIPKIKIGAYDKKLKRYALDITYYVKKYTLAAKHPGAPKGRVPGFVKKYDYIYTGKNKDILDLNIELNALYVLEMSSVQNKDLQITPNPAINNDPEKTNDYLIPDENQSAAEIARLKRYASTPVQGDSPAVVAVSQNTQTRVAPGADQPSRYIAADVQRSLTNSAKGEMVQVQLKIIGDPHFIKQDDIFSDSLNPLQKNNAQFVNGFNPILGQQQNTGSSLYMDGGELYVYLNFVTPVDYNEQTSLMDFDPNYRFSKYNGVYKIVTVDNVFSKGKFEQTLLLAKLFYDQSGQELPNVFSGKREPITGFPVPKLPVSRYSGPLINLTNPISQIPNALRSVQQLSQSTIQSAALIPSLVQGIATQVATRTIGQLVSKGTNEVITGVGRIFSRAAESVTDLAQNGISGAANNFGFEVTTDPTQFGLPDPGDLVAYDFGSIDPALLEGII